MTCDTIGFAIVVCYFLFNRSAWIVFLDQTFRLPFYKKAFTFYGAVVEEDLYAVGKLVVLIIGLLMWIASFIINLNWSVAQAIDVGYGAGAVPVFMIFGKQTVFDPVVEVSFHHGIPVFIIANVFSNKSSLVFRQNKIDFLNVVFLWIVIGSLFPLCGSNE